MPGRIDRSHRSLLRSPNGADRADGSEVGLAGGDHDFAGGQATRVVELYRQQFREGKRTVFDLLDSEQILFAARNSRITNELAMHAAEYRVLQKLGGLFNLASNGEALPKLALPVDELRRHLRRFLLVKDESGRQLYFRYYDPRVLRLYPKSDWVPKALQDKPIYVFETGGTTGIPKSRISIEDFRIDYELFEFQQQRRSR